MIFLCRALASAKYFGTVFPPELSRPLCCFGLPKSATAQIIRSRILDKKPVMVSKWKYFSHIIFRLSRRPSYHDH